MKLISQSVVIVLSTLLLFGIINYNLLPYSPFFLGIFFVVAIIYAIIKKRRGHTEIFSANSFEIFTILTSVLLVIFLTGGIKSPIFFLVYFLLFGITFIFEPITIFIFLLGSIILFGPQSLEGDAVSHLVKLGSLVILAPIAFFFAREHKKRERLSDQVKMTSEEIIRNASEMLKVTKKTERDRKAREIIKEAKEIKTKV